MPLPGKIVTLDQLTPAAYLPLILRQASRPLFVGLHARWDGVGYIRTDETYDVGLHSERDALERVDDDAIRVHTQEWYDPNPKSWPASTWDSLYSISTGHFLSGAAPADPAWKWRNPWILPYDWQFAAGQVLSVDGQTFLVSGPHTGEAAFGRPVQYWELVNTTTFVFWDGGGDWQQLVGPGDITLCYDAGPTRLLLHRDVLRTYSYQGQPTAYTVQYVEDLTATNALEGAGAARAMSTGSGEPAACAPASAGVLKPKCGDPNRGTG
jgi:hypothetical protein